MQVKTQRNDLLKIIAVVSMLIDHIGLVFFPALLEMRVIGRIALPIFTAGVADGYFYTSNIKKYLKRIFLVGVISQVFFMLYFEIYILNIILLFFISLILIELLYNKSIKYRFLYIPLLVLILPGFEYGIYGFLMILFYHLTRNKNILTLSSQGLLIFISSCFWANFIRPFHFLGVLVVAYLPKNILRVNIGKYFFYWFYPVHLLILYIIKQSLNISLY